ncbi:hypothetical protein I3843_14G085400 [Carya illinoinensis]|nr:hypothetical protein I3843_14G085400 [Carya illinoinensis]
MKKTIEGRKSEAHLEIHCRISMPFIAAVIEIAVKLLSCPWKVEFYFSDSNLPRDNFLMKSINETDDRNS